MKYRHPTIPAALRVLAPTCLRLIKDYGWTCAQWCGYAETEAAELDRLLQGNPRDLAAARRLVEATGIYLVEQAETGELTIGWRMPANPLGAAPTTLECHACGKSWTLLPHRGDGRIRCRSCEAERWIGEPYLEQLLPNVEAAFTKPMPA